MIDIAKLREMGFTDAQILIVVEAEAKRAPVRRLHEKDLSGPCFVYCLIFPPTRKPFYIGISSSPWSRFDSHRTDPASGGWPIVKKLLQAGYRPESILKIYKQCADRQAAYDLEHSLITSTKGLLNRNRTHQHHYDYSAMS